MQMFKNKHGKMSIGAILALIGIALVLVAGLGTGLNLFTLTSFLGIGLASILAVIGIVIGFMNVSNVERVPFMVAILVVGATATIVGALGAVGNVISPILLNLGFLVTPAGLVVGLTAIWNVIKK